MSNSFQLLVGAQAFMQELRATLERCQHSLRVQFSTFEGDASGQAFAEMVMGRAAAGVDVRMLLDCYSDVVVNDAYPFLLHRRAEVKAERARTHQLLATMRARGVAIQRTAPPGPLNIYMLHRDHKKMIVLDEQVAFVGGINISDHNFAWHDFAVKITGPLVGDIARDFNSTWDGATHPFSEPQATGDFILNQAAGRYPIRDHILALLGRAQESVIIMSPYLLGDNFERAIIGAAERGVRVELILPYHNNKLIHRIWVRHMQKRFAAHPAIIVYGYRGAHDMLHAKLVVVDGQRASFGSYNLFEIEGLTQKELNVFTDNPDFIAQLQALIRDDLANSTPLAPPRITWGRASYRLVYNFFSWWNRRLLRDPAWKATYS